MADRPVVTVKLSLSQVDTLQKALDMSVDHIKQQFNEEGISAQEKAGLRTFAGKCTDLRQVLS